jgi:hypothetical protein
MRVVNIDPSTLEENPFQPQRRTDKNGIKPLLANIRENGVLVPLAITAEHYLLDGHRRRECALLLDLKKVPCIVHDSLTEENFGLLNQSTKAIGSAGWVEAFVRSEGAIKEMPRAERKRCVELLKIFGSYKQLDRWFVSKGQGSNSVLKFMTQFTNMFAANDVKSYPSKKQIGMWMLHHNLAWVCRNLIKDLLKGKSNTSSRLKKLAKKIGRNEAIDDEF